MTVKAVKKGSVAEAESVAPKWVISHVAGDPVNTELKEAMGSD